MRQPWKLIRWGRLFFVILRRWSSTAATEVSARVDWKGIRWESGTVPAAVSPTQRFRTMSLPLAGWEGADNGDESEDLLQYDAIMYRGHSAIISNSIGKALAFRRFPFRIYIYRHIPDWLRLSSRTQSGNFFINNLQTLKLFSYEKTFY